MKMKKLAALALSTVLGMFVLTGCSTSMSFTYEVGTGDTVKVELDTSEGFLLEDNGGSFAVTEDDETILQGVFITEDDYDFYMEMVEVADGVENVEEDSADGITWLFYNFNGNAGEESNFIVWIDGSDTGVLLGSLEGSRTAKKAFESLTFTVE